MVSHLSTSLASYLVSYPALYVTLHFVHLVLYLVQAHHRIPVGSRWVAMSPVGEFGGFDG